VNVIVVDGDAIDNAVLTTRDELTMQSILICYSNIRCINDDIDSVVLTTADY